ncbi:MAG TPA: TlpA disulfide reductase family protein [Nocardioides sp.]|nr:TlpA disulfide reductase family protein [Nocardioides sp.]
MVVRRRATALVAVLLLLTAACTGQPDVAQDPPPSVDVDTPELRAQKAAAGIEDCPTAKNVPPAEAALPDLTLPCLGGGPAVDLSTLKGPLVVNLWAQWCAPCRDELPFYQRLHEEGAGKVRVLGIDYLDPQPGGALALAEATGVTFPSLADPDGRLREVWRVRGLPGVLFVDEQGRVTNPDARPTYRVIESYDQLTDLVREHLGVDL